MNQSLCGYQIRLESRKGHLTQLLYVTTGILIRKLKNDSLLKGIRYIILDEVHESTVELQFLLILLKRILLVRTDLTLVLMSATMESEKLVRYFQDYEAPLISVPGRTFPVEPFFLEDAIEFTRYSLEEDSFYALPYLKTQSTKQSTKVNVTGKSGTSSQLTLQWDKRDLEENPYEFSESSVPIPKFANCDPKKYSSLTQLTMSRIDSSKIQYDLIEYLLIYICSQDPFQNIEGSILIFLPGIAEIQKLYSQLQSHPKFSNSRKFIILPLHSILSTNNQRLVFEVPPKGVRKIVLATNIAETGITIPDAVFVIDTGRVKEMRYDDSKNMNCLEEIFISKANALQRRGRAGRVREGFCFHLFSQSRFLSGLVPYPQPELTRVSLDELCLHIKALDIGSPAEILGQALDPPSLSSIESALQKLRFVRALDALDNITPLGIHLSTLPVDVHIGKMLLLATIFSCLDPILVIAATISSSKSPFTISLDNQVNSYFYFF